MGQATLTARGPESAAEPTAPPQTRPLNPRRVYAGAEPSGKPIRGCLSARGVSVDFEGLRAVDSVDLVVERDEILGLIGPNGAGKTTLVNVLSGFQLPTSGSVWVDESDITRRSAAARARRGIGRTFQAVRLFKDLSLLENVQLGAIGIGLRPREARNAAWTLLEWVGLADRAVDPAGSLPYGDERRVGIARAFAGRPRFLLLDEPAAGLNEAETDSLIPILQHARDEYRCGLLVVEHDMTLIMRLCDRVQVLDYGQTIAVGPPEAIRADPAVISAYLGTDDSPSTNA